MMCEAKPTNSRWFLDLFSDCKYSEILDGTFKPLYQLHYCQELAKYLETISSLRAKNPVTFSSFFPPPSPALALTFDELTSGKYQVLFFIDNNHLLVYSIAESEFLILKECDKTTDKIQELYKNKFVYDKSNIMILTKRKSSYYNLRDPIWQNIPVQNIVNFSPKIL